MSRSPLSSSPPLPTSSTATSSPPSYCYRHHWQNRQFRNHYLLIILGTTWLATQVNIWESVLALFAKSARWQYHHYHHRRRHYHPHHQNWHQLNYESHHHYCINWQQQLVMKMKPALSVIIALRILSVFEHHHSSALSSASTICSTTRRDIVPTTTSATTALTEDGNPCNVF